MPVIHQGYKEERHSCLENQGVWKVCWSFRGEAISVENALAKRVNKKIILKNELGEINIQLFLSTTALGSKVQKEQTPGEKRAGHTLFKWEIKEGHHWKMATEIAGRACLGVRVTVTSEECTWAVSEAEKQLCRYTSTKLPVQPVNQSRSTQAESFSYTGPLHYLSVLQR